MDQFLSIHLRQEVSDFHDNPQVKEGCPRDLFYV